MRNVKPKKYLGQHFLNDENIARKVVDSLSLCNYLNVLEIGPGTGVLTKYLIKKNINLKLIEIDNESVKFLKLLGRTARIRIIKIPNYRRNLWE